MACTRFPTVSPRCIPGLARHASPTPAILMRPHHRLLKPGTTTLSHHVSHAAFASPTQHLFISIATVQECISQRLQGWCKYQSPGPIVAIRHSEAGDATTVITTAIYGVLSHYSAVCIRVFTWDRQPQTVRGLCESANWGDRGWNW